MDIPKNHQILIVDDEPALRSCCRYILQSERIHCDEAKDGEEALKVLQTRPYDLVLLDVDMPRLKGPEVCRHLRENPPCSHLKIIMLSGRAAVDELAEMMLAGADDFLPKPFSSAQLEARVKAALRLKDAQDRAVLLNRHLLRSNQELEQTITLRDMDLIAARNALVLALAKLAEHRDNETGAHLMRLERYTHCLAKEAARTTAYVDELDENFIAMLSGCAPLHDIGKVGIPDYILHKPGPLNHEERLIMQSHTIIGAQTLLAVAEQHRFALAFLQMAADIARHHHEHFAGTGYPDQLVGTAIPLSARLVAVADVYDALRSRRVYKPAYSHEQTVEIMRKLFSTQFDPALAQPFERCLDRFDAIYREYND